LGRHLIERWVDSAGIDRTAEVAKRTSALLAPPFVAALVGAFVGGLVIRADWTATQNLCLIVPALMLVPGPHLINGIEDVLENEIQAGICRLGLAIAILLAAALGVAVGAWLIIGTIAEAAPDRQSVTVPLVDIVLAGVASAGFSTVQNPRGASCGCLSRAARSGMRSAPSVWRQGSDSP
jgi:succinate dehydrogenase hydrophobic anchor subunit